MRLLPVMLLASAATTPAFAQHHSAHTAPSAPSAPAAAQTDCEAEAARHRAMGHAVPEGACAPDPAHAGHPPAQAAPDNGGTDHSQMDHSHHAAPPTPVAAQVDCEAEAARHRAMGHAVPEGACAPDPAHAGHPPAQAAPDNGGTDHSQMDHSHHAAPPTPVAAQVDCEAEAARHRAMGHAVPEGACAPDPAHAGHPPAQAAPDNGEMNHSQMDHSRMDHSQMDHSQMDHGAMPAMDHSGMDHADAPATDGAQAGHDHAATAPMRESLPPVEAGSGPPRAADAIWGANAMRASREALLTEHGAMKWFWFQGDRAEYRMREGRDGYLWDVQGYYGGDIDKFWFKSEGEGSFREKPESAEIQGLWSHAIGPWWDLQAGLRQDLVGPERTHAVIGVQGLAPYKVEVDAAAFLSTKGDLTARIEAELDQRITQRLILQPRAEVTLSAQDVPELGIGAGFDSVELGLRLRYEIAREFAPYVGIEQEWKTGRSADYARLAGEDPSVTNFVAGIRFWF